MKAITLLIFAIAASPASAQDDPAARLKKRIEIELRGALADSREDLRIYTLRQLSKEGIGRGPGPLSPEAFGRELTRFVHRLPDTGIEGRLKTFLSTEEGRLVCADLIAQAGFESLDDAVENYFERDKNGRYKIREELEPQLEQLLDMIAPEGPAPDAPPKPSAPPKKAFLGFKPDPLTDADRRDLGLAAPKGVKAWEIVDDSPADKAGLQTGDVLLSIGGKELTLANVDEVMGSFRPGEEVEVVYFHGRSKHTVKASLEGRIR